MLELVTNVTDSYAEDEVRLEYGRAWRDKGSLCRQNRGQDATLGNPGDHKRQGEKRDEKAQSFWKFYKIDRRELATCQKRVGFSFAPEKIDVFLFLSHSWSQSLKCPLTFPFQPLVPPSQLRPLR